MQSQKNLDIFREKEIITFSENYINVFDPKLEDIKIEDIAHALSQLCRWNGHTKTFYSVAQHSIWVCENVQQEHKLAALLHDASEAYLVDIPRPIKVFLKDYKKLEDSLMKVISQKFNFKYPFDQIVKDADDLALQYEWDNYIKLTHSVNLSNNKDIEKQFLEIFKQLYIE